MTVLKEIAYGLVCVLAFLLGHAAKPDRKDFGLE